MSRMSQFASLWLLWMHAPHSCPASSTAPATAIAMHILLMLFSAAATNNMSTGDWRLYLLTPLHLVDYVQKSACAHNELATWCKSTFDLGPLVVGPNWDVVEVGNIW